MVVGNLWDVTDKDIDRFCVHWLDTVVGTASANNSSESTCSVSSGNTCSESSGSSVDVLRLVCECREVCKMKYMIGAAPVCYGVPMLVHCTAGMDEE